jgi:hypothetical protein
LRENVRKNGNGRIEMSGDFSVIVDLKNGDDDDDDCTKRAHYADFTVNDNFF